MSVFVEHYLTCPESSCPQVFFGFVQAVVIGRRVGDVRFAHEDVALECF